MPDSSERTPKLYDVWEFVLLRGFIEGALLASMLGLFREPGPLALLIVGVLIGGSLVELLMARQLRGHAFRGILIFVGCSGAAIAALIFYYYFFVSDARVTLGLLIVMMGLWVAVRGFAALWLGLSIVSGTFERALPIGAGVVGLSVGLAGLLFFDPGSPVWFVRLLALYGVVSLILHVLLARRMRRDRRRVEHERSSEAEASAG